MILAIETSCDETSMAVMDEAGRVTAHRIYSQIADHQPYGGVVPEVASRCHVEALPPMLDEVLAGLGEPLPRIRGVAFTRGPGLATSLLTGMASARALAVRLGCPLAGVNHLHGHAVSVRMTEGGEVGALALPALILLVSGGHTLLLLEEEPTTYQVLGQTLDDAAGEALDKGAKLLGLGYPGGPEIEREAGRGDPAFVPFPRGMSRPDPNPARALCFSFSGLKTSLRTHLGRHPDQLTSHLPDLAASYQEAVVASLLLRVRDALDRYPGVRTLGCAGGVARNRRLRALLAEEARRRSLVLALTPPAYCADNAAMIAASAHLAGDWVDPVSGNVDVLPGWGL